MKQRMITALAILAVVLPPLILGGNWLYLLIGAFVLLAVHEILSCLFKKNHWVLYGFLVSAVGLMAVSSLKLFSAFIPLVLILLFVFCICSEEFSVDKISIVFVFVMLIVLTVRAMLMIYGAYGPLVMVHILLATYLTDTGAYFCGRFFGKHKLNERISPKKTIEGSIGGWFCGAVFSFLFGFFFLKELPFVLMCFSSILMPVVGQIGDLAFSAIKRHEGIKDFGNIFPGHGGVLDRIDSLIFNLILWMSLYRIFVMVM